MNIFQVDVRWAFKRWLAKHSWDPRKPYPVKNPDEVIGLILQNDLFKDVPEENLRNMVAQMETVKRLKGDKVIREGEEGDYFYLLSEGTVAVTRTGKSGKVEHLVDLQKGSGFGEEALISFAKRNATVSMTTKGLLHRLPKEAFVQHVQNALVTWVSTGEAQRLINNGARWLDVREADKSHHGHLHGAISIPLSALRSRMDKMGKDVEFVCYCQNGRASATAAFLMKQRGFKVSVLRGGLNRLK